MTELLNINEIISLIPTVLEYVVPGFIFLTIRDFSYSKKDKSDKYYVIKCIVLSYIFIKLLKPIVLGFFGHFSLSDDILTFIFIILVIAISIGYIKYKIEEKLVNTLGNGKTVHEDFISNIICNKEGAWLKLYISEEKSIYTGQLRYYDNPSISNNRFIVLACVKTESYSGDTLVDNMNNKDCLVALDMKDIKRIEIFK